MEIAELRSKIDMETLYVDFTLIRTALTVVSVAGDLKVVLSEAGKDGERRGTCPKCEKERSFSLNVNTNRFNCFAKGCNLKGGGVIDFFAKLYSVSAKEASHLLAFIYGIQPYTLETAETAIATGDNQPNAKPIAKAEAETVPVKREVPEPSPDASRNIPQITPQHLIASIERQLFELKQLLLLSQ
jgi:DNA primase